MELFRAPSSEFLDGGETYGRVRRNSLGGGSAWEDLKESNRPLPRQYVIFAAPPFEQMAKTMQASAPSRFRFFPISWAKYPDGTDNITIEGFTPVNHVASSHILFFASFHNNDVTLSQFSVLVVLLQSFIKSMTIVLPFFPVGTNERVTVEGKVATANTYSSLLSSLPNTGQPARLMIYDIHALQERFYFHGSTLPSLHTTVPLLLERLATKNSGSSGSGMSSSIAVSSSSSGSIITNPDIRTVAFPDDGAAKRFKYQFEKLGFNIIICGKVRNGDKRHVTIQEGLNYCKGSNIVIVDDLVQTGGTLYECALALKNAGALEVSTFVAHAVFPSQSWKRFDSKLDNHGNKGDRAVFKYFWVTNSIPVITNELPNDSCFEVFDLCSIIRKDLDDIHK